jgi:uncharacterized repeat protein (TIGR01451 family)
MQGDCEEGRRCQVIRAARFGLLALATAFLIVSPAATAANAAVISTSAGDGVAGFSGDGAQATSAELNAPAAVAPMSDGGFLVADTANNRIREVFANGTITTVAGNGIAGFSGDGGLATSAELNAPTGVAPTPGGGFLIADQGNERIREVTALGVISTVAGNGTAGFAGDGGPAASAELNSPTSVTPTSDGGFLVADTANNRIRKVSAGGATGAITTVAGNGIAGFNGDGVPATSAELNAPKGVAPTPSGGFLIADTQNNRVRSVTPPADLSVTSSAPATAASGEKLVYTISVTNTGGQSTTALNVTDSLPATVHFDSLSTSQGTCTPASGSKRPTTKDGMVACSLDQLAAGDTMTLMIVVTVTRPGVITNAATATADNVAADTDDTSTATTRVRDG